MGGLWPTTLHVSIHLSIYIHLSRELQHIRGWKFRIPLAVVYHRQPRTYLARSNDSLIDGSHHNPPLLYRVVGGKRQLYIIMCYYIIHDVFFVLFLKAFSSAPSYYSAFDFFCLQSQLFAKKKKKCLKRVPPNALKTILCRTMCNENSKHFLDNNGRGIVCLLYIL